MADTDINATARIADGRIISELDFGFGKLTLDVEQSAMRVESQLDILDDVLESSYDSFLRVLERLAEEATAKAAELGD